MYGSVTDYMKYHTSKKPYQNLFWIAQLTDLENSLEEAKNKQLEIEGQEPWDNFSVTHVEQKKGHICAWIEKADTACGCYWINNILEHVGIHVFGEEYA